MNVHTHIYVHIYLFVYTYFCICLDIHIYIYIQTRISPHDVPQVSQWINDYLGAPGITISDVVAAAQPAGIGHDPPKRLGSFEDQGEQCLNNVARQSYSVCYNWIVLILLSGIYMYMYMHMYMYMYMYMYIVATWRFTATKTGRVIFVGLHLSMFWRRHV